MPARLASLICAAALVLAACGTTSTPSASPAPSGSPAQPTPGPSASPFALRPAPANLGCDAVPATYRQVVFHIDPAASDPVTATTETGKVLKTFWMPGFVGGTAADPTVRNATGQVVVADGQVLPIPNGAWPRLAGHFVCPSTDALYVFLTDPE